MLAAMLLSEDLVSSSTTSNLWYLLGAQCNGHSGITWAAVWSNAPHSHIDVRASPLLCMDDWNLSTPVRRRLIRVQEAGLGRTIPSGLALGLVTKRRSYNWSSEYFSFHLLSIHRAAQMLCLDNSLSSLRAAGTKGVEIVALFVFSDDTYY